MTKETIKQVLLNDDAEVNQKLIRSSKAFEKLARTYRHDMAAEKQEPEFLRGNKV